MAEKRFLIIGQGLAGTILSQKLLALSVPHTVVDNNHLTAATRAAAGIINPITGRRYVKSWMIDDLLPIARETYREFENVLQTQFVKERNILRALLNVKEENAWHEATSRIGYESYVKKPELDSYNEIVLERLAYGEIRHGMQVAVSDLILNYRELLINKGLLSDATFDVAAYNYDSEAYSYNNQHYDAIIFCDGYRSIFNPLFKHLPFQPAKGESFTIAIEKQLPKKLMRDGIFIAPINSNTFWSGGGYIWDDLSEKPTELFRQQWTKKLGELLKVPHIIQSHRAGVRPSVKGRRPLIGQHYKYPRVYLFNGMGTKGTSIAPYWAEKLIELLLNKTPISEEVDLNRFVTN